jgi:hypothetical protein
VASERRVAPPAVGTVSFRCATPHCGTVLAVLGPAGLFWSRRHGRTVQGQALTLRIWCERCGRENVAIRADQPC